MAAPAIVPSRVRALPADAAPAAAPALGGEVLITADPFGVGGVARPGDLAGIRLALTDRGDRVRNTVVRLRLRDPDGDTLLVERPITLNPGRPQALWLYAILPPSFDRLSLLAITVHESATSNGRLVAGRQIASASIAPSRVAPIQEGLIAVVGRRGGGLTQYSVRDDSGAPSPTSNEPIDVITGLDPAGLPDAWMGLAQFDALVWLEGDPSTLRADQADALRRWVRRGGRLLIALPAVGQLWTTNANPLLDLMPAMLVRRREGVDLGAYRPLITTRRAIPLPDRAVVHVFEPSPFAGSQDAMPVLAGPDGATIAMRRLIGLGSVTVLGINPASPGLTGRVEAQVFWHRLLGQRFDIRSRTQIIDATNQRNFPRPAAVVVDSGIAGLINKTGSAGVGVLLGLIVFAAYFLLAGPVGFAVLSALGYRRHAWLAFVGVSAVFTIIAWGGATLIRPRTTDATHLSILDSVAGQDLVRVRSWFSVLLPTYGTQTVSIVDPATADLREAPHNTLWPWREPSSAERASFPDQRAYTIDSRRPDTIRLPTRSTVKEFEARWVGPPPVRLPRSTTGEIRLDANGVLVGSLVHELPAPLEGVIVVLNRGQTPLVQPREGGPLLANIWAWSPFGSDAWAPGEPFDLSALDYRDADTGEQFFTGLTRGVGALSSVLEGGALSRTDRALDAITWFGALNPPDWTKAFGVSAARRETTHGLDLSRWMTQPCLIIVGTLAESELPIPLTVDGARPPSHGRTLVRWVYPLPPNPPRPMRTGF